MFFPLSLYLRFSYRLRTQNFLWSTRSLYFPYGVLLFSRFCFVLGPVSLGTQHESILHRGLPYTNIHLLPSLNFTHSLFQCFESTRNYLPSQARRDMRFYIPPRASCWLQSLYGSIIKGGMFISKGGMFLQFFFLKKTKFDRIYSSQHVNERQLC